MKLCVFPNDPLSAYLAKGEIKDRYFNPQNLFDEVHVISLFDSDVKPEQVAILAGDARLHIHVLGKANLLNYKKMLGTARDLVHKIKPDVLRAYNSVIQGYMAVHIGRDLEIPSVVSIHTNPDQNRQATKETKDYTRYLKLRYAKKLEKYSIQNADHVICVYNFLTPYATQYRTQDLSVMYNKVNGDLFNPNIAKKFTSTRPVVLSVGRMIDQKDHSILVQAISQLDCDLLIIGDGPNRGKLDLLVKELGIQDKVQIIPSVPNEELGSYYTACDVYVQPLFSLGGVAIPVLEAMSCGLPVIMSKQEDAEPEATDSAILFAENTAGDFAATISRVLEDSTLARKMRADSLKVASEIGGDKMEEKECELYKKLLERH